MGPGVVGTGTAPRLLPRSRSRPLLDAAACARRPGRSPACACSDGRRPRPPPGRQPPHPHRPRRCAAPGRRRRPGGRVASAGAGDLADRRAPRVVPPTCPTCRPSSTAPACRSPPWAAARPRTRRFFAVAGAAGTVAAASLPAARRLAPMAQPAGAAAEPDRRPARRQPPAHQRASSPSRCPATPTRTTRPRSGGPSSGTRSRCGRWASRSAGRGPRRRPARAGLPHPPRGLRAARPRPRRRRAGRLHLATAAVARRPARAARRSGSSAARRAPAADRRRRSPPCPAIPQLVPPVRRPWPSGAPVTFGYRGEARDGRPVPPLVLPRAAGTSTATTTPASDDRQFRLDRIEGDVAVGAAGSFERPDAPAPAGRRSPWQLGGDEPVVARLRVDADQAGWALDHLGDADGGRASATTARVVVELHGHQPRGVPLVRARLPRPRRGARPAGAARTSWSPGSRRSPDGRAPPPTSGCAGSSPSSRGSSPPTGPTVEEVCRRFGLAEAELIAELDLVWCCGVHPFTPDTLIEVTSRTAGSGSATPTGSTGRCA